jgi:predicted nucleic acid-binding protein
MILLDTNVISEPTKLVPDLNVRAWLDSQDVSSLYAASTSIAEVFLGIETMPEGLRKTRLRQRTSDLLDLLFGTRILPFDEAAAKAYASLLARARAKGRSILMADGQIAAIAQVHGLAVATRDTSPFEAAGIPVIDPWKL